MDTTIGSNFLRNLGKDVRPRQNEMNMDECLSLFEYMKTLGRGVRGCLKRVHKIIKTIRSHALK